MLPALFFALALFAPLTAAQQGATGPLSVECLGCICEAISNCNRTLTCSGDVCGLFRITWAYWSDAGKPVLQGDNPSADGAYGRCTVDPYCAALTVQQYMTKYSQDCNRDGSVDCTDFARIHKLGGYGCGAPLDPIYEQKYTTCINHVQTLG
ncbi:lysozyme-like [Neocloeon triangulifer]|uniref:lysozyme-like n=1 Tax=Neocloeon triangulifer TaxID=2078957 RepID=UPI00286EE37A|nr:lysozyme-like [Neocloeon triangulifer]